MRTSAHCAPSASTSPDLQPTMKPRILVIDDESAIRDSLKMILEYEGFEVQGAATGQDGLDAGRP